MEFHRETFWITDDSKLLPTIEVIGLYHQSHWASDYSREKIERLLETSFWLGLFNQKKLVGLARVVTDKTTHSWICDFIVDKEFRNRGWGSWLLECLLKHPYIESTSMGLGTPNADSFFEKFGFERDGSVMLRAWRPSWNPTNPTSIH